MSAMQRTPLKRKRTAGKRRTASACKVLRCKRRIATAELCRTHAVARCDVLARAICRALYGRCARCGETDSLQWSHHLSRRYMNVRWQLANAVMHCVKCHTYLTYHPEEHAAWSEEYVGRDQWERLRTLAFGSDVKFTTTDLAEWLLLLEATAPTEKG